MHDDDAVGAVVEVVSHAGDDGGDQGEGRRMVVWEWGVEDADAAEVGVVVACSLCAELPERPGAAVFAVEEGEDFGDGVAVKEFGEGYGGHGHGDYDGFVGGDVAEVEVGFLVLEARTSDDGAQ